MGFGQGTLNWSRERLETVAQHVCDPAAVEEALQAADGADATAVGDLLHQARSLEGLTPRQAAVLLNVEDPDLRNEIITAAREVHDKAFGRRISLFAPVCPTNRCVNDCLYCPLRRSNARLHRSHTGIGDLQREIAGLLDCGHRYVQLIFGEDRSGVAYVRDMVHAAYGARQGLRQMQRVDINVNPLNAVELKQLKSSVPLGTYHVYQETYHPKTYTRLHPDGPKADYARRLVCHDEALTIGMDDVGLGILLGVYEYRFDVIAMLMHAAHLNEVHGVAPHTFNIPRLTASADAPGSQTPYSPISDALFMFITAVLRLAAPFADIALSTPATRDTRRDLYATGISSVSVGSESYPGVYTADGDPEAGGALVIGRPRNVEILVYRMAEAGFIPNFCVACYIRRRRAAILDQKDPQEYRVRHCTPNSLLALHEYLLDHASSETRVVGERLIQKELSRLPEQVRRMTLERMEEADAGFRELML